MCNVRLCKCAFCFATRCRSLAVSAPEGICGCAGIGFRTLLRCLITPLALKQAEILQPFVSVYPLTVAPGSWSDVSSSITMPEWTSRDALFHPHRQQALSDEMADGSTMSRPFLKVFHHGAARFCHSLSLLWKKDDFKLWLVNIFAVIWCDRACHFCYFISVFADSLCVV